MQPFTRRVVELIRAIPPGRVMTYGQIARAAGNRRGARQVVRILHSLSAPLGLPWHRVVNAEGRIGLSDEEGRSVQRALLEAEGVVFGADGRIDLAEYLHADLPMADEVPIPDPES